MLNSLLLFEILNIEVKKIVEVVVLVKRFRTSIWSWRSASMQPMRTRLDPSSLRFLPASFNGGHSRHLHLWRIFGSTTREESEKSRKASSRAVLKTRSSRISGRARRSIYGCSAQCFTFWRDLHGFSWCTMFFRFSQRVNYFFKESHSGAISSFFKLILRFSIFSFLFSLFIHFFSIEIDIESITTEVQTRPGESCETQCWNFSTRSSSRGPTSCDEVQT